MKLTEYMKAARLSPDKDDKTVYMTMSDKMLSNAFVNGKRNSPSVCSTYDVDATKFMEAFNKLKSECGYKLTLVLSLFIISVAIYMIDYGNRKILSKNKIYKNAEKNHI